MHEFTATEDKERRQRTVARQEVAPFFSAYTYEKNRSVQPDRSVGRSLGGIHPMWAYSPLPSKLARTDEELLKVLVIALVVGECGTFMT